MASCVKLFRLGRPDCSNPVDVTEPCCSGTCRPPLDFAAWDVPACSQAFRCAEHYCCVERSVSVACMHQQILDNSREAHPDMPITALPALFQPCTLLSGGNFGARFGYLNVAPGGLMALWSLSAGAAYGRTPLYNCTGPLSGALRSPPPPPVDRRPPPPVLISRPQSPPHPPPPRPSPPLAHVSPPPSSRPPSPSYVAPPPPLPPWTPLYHRPPPPPVPKPGFYGHPLIVLRPCCRLRRPDGRGCHCQEVR